MPRAIDSRYPYSDTGAFPGAVTGECLEQFTLLAFLAAITTRPRLLTSVTVVPHRGAIETAKLVSTIDNLSGGRFTFGVGAGWMEEEFKALQAPCCAMTATPRSQNARFPAVSCSAEAPGRYRW